MMIDIALAIVITAMIAYSGLMSWLAWKIDIDPNLERNIDNFGLFARAAFVVFLTAILVARAL